jgi:hypothetical protein
MDPLDEVTLSSGEADTLSFSFKGDLFDDSFTFEAEATDWVEILTDTDEFDEIEAGETGTVNFSFRTKPEIPPRWRLNMTVSADPDDGFIVYLPTFSDFYLGVAAPDVALSLLKTEPDEQPEPPCTCPTGDTLFILRPRLLNLGDADADSLLLRMEMSGAEVEVCDDTVWMDVDAGEEAWSSGEFSFCDNGRTMRIDALLVSRWVHGDSTLLASYDSLNPWPIGTVVVEDSLLAESVAGGMRVTWSPVGGDSVLGYHVYFDTTDASSPPVRVTKQPVTEATMVWLRDLDFYEPGSDSIPIPYEFGVSVVSTNYVEGPVEWESVQYSTLPERQGWPQKAPKGAITSVTLVDLDSDSDLEILTGGRVISAWNANGIPLSGTDDGLLFDPVPDDSNFDQPTLEFFSELAAADIDLDGETEIVGCYGNDSLYVVDETGQQDWNIVHAVWSRSRPTLADINKDDSLEVIVNSRKGGKLFVFRNDGRTYRREDGCEADSGLFAQPAMDDNAKAMWNFAGVAVADFEGDSLLEIVQPVTSGWVYAWRADSTGCASTSDPETAWTQHVRADSSGNVWVSTPAVAEMTGDDTVDVVVSAPGVWSQVQVIDGDTGDWLPSGQGRWHGVGVDEILVGYGESNEHVQPPSLGDLGDTDALEIVICRNTDTLEVLNTPRTKIALLHDKNSLDILTCVDEIMIPGRRGRQYPITVGYPIIGDIDGDGKKEILAASIQGGLFCWEATWNSGADSFECSPEKGWPMIFPEAPGTPAIGDLDGDGFRELVVPAGDYVYVYDLPGMQVDPEWGTAAHDARRTGHVEGGGNGQPFMPQDPNAADLAGDGGLMPSGPNPFNPVTMLRFRVPSRSKVKLAIYDVTGRRVRVLVDGLLPPGVHERAWDGRSDSGETLSSGVFFARLKIGKFEQKRKLVILK